MSGGVRSWPWQALGRHLLLIAAAALGVLSLVSGLAAEDAGAVVTPTALWLALAVLALACRLTSRTSAVPAAAPGRFGRGELLGAGLAFAALLLIVYGRVLDCFPSDTDEWLILKGIWTSRSAEPIDWPASASGILWLRLGGALPQLALAQLCGLSPLALRMLALLMQAGSGVLILALARRIGLSRGGALAAALLFLLYAPNHEMITLFSATPFAQATLLLLGGLLLLERSVDPGARGARLQLAAGLVCGLLAALSKEIALVFPVLLPALGLAVDREGPRAALHRRRWTLLGALVAVVPVLVVLFTAPVSGSVDPSGRLQDQRAVMLERIEPGALWTAFVDVLPRALAVPFSAEVLPGASGPLAGVLLCGMALLIGAVGLAPRPALRVLAGLGLLVAAGFAPAFFEAAPHHFFLEDTRYFTLPSVGSGLLLAAALDQGLARGRRWRWPLVGGTALLLAASIAALPVTLGVRSWFADNVAHVSGELGRTLRERSEADELFLVCALGTVDRSGMESALLAQVLAEPARPRVHLLSGLRFRERLGPGRRSALAGPVIRIRPGPQRLLLGWPPGRESGFGPLDTQALWQLVSADALDLPAACPGCQTIAIEFGDDIWVFEGELRRDVTFRSIVERA